MEDNLTEEVAQGEVALVGAGPGDPSLLNFKSTTAYATS